MNENLIGDPKMFRLKQKHIATALLTISMLTNLHSSAMAAEDELTGSSECASPLYDTSASLRRSAIDLLKDDLFIRFRAQTGHREHMEMYDYSKNEIREAVMEVHDWMWNYSKERAIRFFEAYDYEDCMFEDVLFVGALHDIFINQTATNRREQWEFLEILKDSSRYISYAY
jgi:hypothetical protein